MSIPLLQVKAPQSNVTETINTLLRGRANNVGSVTLTENVTTTDVIDTRIRSQMIIVLSPRTSNAAAELPTLYVSAVDDGGFTLTHSSAASTDRTYDFIFHGG